VLENFRESGAFLDLNFEQAGNEILAIVFNPIRPFDLVILYLLVYFLLLAGKGQVTRPHLERHYTEGPNV
jgi:hypothetical protein